MGSNTDVITLFGTEFQTVDIGTELTCSDCFFYDQPLRICNQLKCSPTFRADGRNVIFVEVKHD